MTRHLLLFAFLLVTPFPAHAENWPGWRGPGNRGVMGSSPILAGGTLYVQVDHWSQSYLLAVDPKAGANKWKADRPGAVNWSSPLVVDVMGRTELITFGTFHVRSYDADTGSEL